MTDFFQRTSTTMASSGLLPIPSSGSDSSNRPRNRRAASSGLDTDGPVASTSTSLLSAGSASSPASRRASPGGLRSQANSGGKSRDALNTPSASHRRGNSPARDHSKPSAGKGLFEGSWATSWASVQGLASSLLSGDASDADLTTSRNASQSQRSVSALERERSRPATGSWGPVPPNKQRPRLEDVAAGSLAEREAALRAVRTASVLESHDGVNGGLDITGRYKKRSSDEDLRGSAKSQEPEEYLAYVHHVQSTDTYAGIVLKYRCREDAFRKANGLWSRDNIQIRKHLVIPVDTCEVKGRTCDPPSYRSQNVDLLAPTPTTTSEAKEESTHDDFFAPRPNGKVSEPPPQTDEAQPWTHVRWVSLESFPQPVEIGRVSRRHTGYFPPRRKKSQHTLSTLSTPRESLDMSGIGSTGQVDSPNSTSSRRPSVMSSGRPPTHAYSNSIPSGSTSRSRGGSVGPEDPRPAWMRRPGGIGSLGKQRAPGPDKDYFNSFARKHFPGINIDSMPSMSVMGSETARFGFSSNNTDAPAVGIVESPFQDGRDVEASSRQGTGLDKAATAVEMWLRGAFAKRQPSTPKFGARRPTSQPGQREDGISDLIELEDTNSEDGRSFGGPLSDVDGGGGSRLPNSNHIGVLSSSTAAGSSGWSGRDSAMLRGKPGSAAVGKGKRAE